MCYSQQCVPCACEAGAKVSFTKQQCVPCRFKLPLTMQECVPCGCQARVNVP